MKTTQSIDTLRLNSQRMQYGSTQANMKVARPVGSLTLDTDEVSLRIHNGITKGGVAKIPSETRVKQLIAQRVSLVYRPWAPNGSTVTLNVDFSQSQRIAFPAGAFAEVYFDGFGPFSYKLGDSNVVALPSDYSVVSGRLMLLAVGSSTHLAVYGHGLGSVRITMGDSV